jgi:hypothetical protein
VPATTTTTSTYSNYLTLLDRPDSYNSSANYVSFKSSLPLEYLQEGDVSLKSVEGFYTDYNIVGLQFTFYNGKKEFTTGLLGVESNGKPT